MAVLILGAYGVESFIGNEKMHRTLTIAAISAVLACASAAETLTVHASGMSATEFGGKSPVLSAAKAEAMNFRRQRVEKIARLKLYPPDYAPSEEVFGGVRDDTLWTRPSGFFVGNPQMLVLETITGQVAPFAYYAPADNPREDYRVEFLRDKIHAVYKNTSANHWFYWIFQHYGSHRRNKLRLWMVNARDAGFSYAMIDAAKSRNIDLDKSGDIVRMPMDSRAFFHYGGNVGANNLSPADSRMVVSLRENVRATKIYVKLWRTTPENAAAPEDFAFIIEAIPNPDADGYLDARGPESFLEHLWFWIKIIGEYYLLFLQIMIGVF